MFTNSKRLVWFNNIVVALLNGWALQKLGAAAVPVLAVSIPAMLGLVGAWTHTTNKAETEHMKIGA